MAEQKVSNHRLLVSSTESADDPPAAGVLAVPGCPGVPTISAVDEDAGAGGALFGSGAVGAGTGAGFESVLAERARASAGELVDGLGGAPVSAADDAGGRLLSGVAAEPGPHADSRQAAAPTRMVPVQRRTVIPFRLGEGPKYPVVIRS
jgi:hypothetical protein